MICKVFFEMCQDDYVLQMHYNCECMATRYLDERIRVGPIESRALIISRINKECVDDAAAAGTAYNKCLKYGGMNYTGGSMSPEEYCQCVGNNYAILLKTSPPRAMGMKYMNQLMTSAYITM